MPQNVCQHFAKVVGTKTTFVPGSDLRLTGERIVFPELPSGTSLKILAVNPARPEEQLWLICVNREVAVDLSAFWNSQGVTQLTYQEMVALGKQYDPNFVPPPIIV